MKLNELTQNERALHGFGGDGSGDQEVAQVSTDADGGTTYRVEDGWFFYSSARGSDAISESGRDGEWKTL